MYFLLVQKDESTLNHLFHYKKVHSFVEQEVGFLRLYKLQALFEHVALTLKLGLLGRDGCGKTTFFNS